jgi:hypothetical protein
LVEHFSKGILQLNLFLLGAGFNVDANGEAGAIYGNSIYEGVYRIHCGYPLVAEVVKLCFGLDELPTGQSVELLFSDALAKNDYKPVEKLVDRLMEADYYIAQRIAASEEVNSSQKFFEKFTGAQFLTYNYDSLPEILLSKKKLWRPEDGYGVSVKTELAYPSQRALGAKSTSLVIHLHGSAIVYTVESEIVGNPFRGVAQLVHTEPRYAFDPGSISLHFPQYRRVVSVTAPLGIEERVIAPIPDKSQDLKRAFVGESYAKAAQLAREAGTLVAIGYSFNVHDRASYSPILDALAQSNTRILFIVSPQARKIAARLSGEHPDIRFEPIEKTFSEWATDSFRRD